MIKGNKGLYKHEIIEFLMRYNVNNNYVNKSMIIEFMNVHYGLNTSDVEDLMNNLKNSGRIIYISRYGWIAR